MLEGVSSTINYDGTQPVRWWLRSDSNGESALAFALRSKIDGDQRSRRVAANLLDWVYFNSGLFQNDPGKADFGLFHWAPDSASLYGDNDIKIILSCMGTAAVLETDRWDEVLLQNILGNFRTTGIYGFRGGSLDDGSLLQLGWQHYWRARTIHYAPHYQAWIWASYLWLYDKTKDPTAAGADPPRDPHDDGGLSRPLAMDQRHPAGAGPDAPDPGLAGPRRRPARASGVAQADGRRHAEVPGRLRGDPRGVGRSRQGQYRPPRSNAEYGTSEASLIQENGDPVADMLYTCNFAFLGLHEAYAATGEPQYREMADRLAEFFVRIQVRSDAHPELDGGWFRAFDYRAVGLLGLQRRRRLGRLVDRGRLDAGLDSHRAGDARIGPEPLGHDQGQQDRQALGEDPGPDAAGGPDQAAGSG